MRPCRLRSRAQRPLEERVRSGIATINGNLARQVARQAISENDRQAALSRIGAADKLEALADCDLIIETVSRRRRQRKILARCAGAEDSAIVATNTPRSRSLGSRPRRSAGKVHRHSFHESGAGDGTGRGDPRIATDDATYETIKAFVTKLGKRYAVAEDFPGFHRQPHPAADDQRGDLHAL